MTDSKYYDETAKLIADASLFLIIASIIILIIAGFVIAGLWKIFEKAHDKGWKALIPFYNFFHAFKLCDLNPWLSLLLYIPVINIWVWIKFALALANAFNQKTAGFIVGLIIAPYIFVWKLGFNKTYEYQYLKGKNIPFAEAFHSPNSIT